jgi:polar amino acid transport system substrate-binding protein
MRERAYLREVGPRDGTLRVAIVVAPVPSPFFAGLLADGQPHGVTVDLARALAAQVGRPLQLSTYPNSGEITAAGTADMWDVAFMPKDAERARLFDFSSPYFVARSTYLAPPASPVQDIDGVNKPGIRAVAIKGTTTARSLWRTAPLAALIEVDSVTDFVASARSGEADAFALSHDTLAGIATQVPGSRILPGEFQSVGVCAAVPKDRPGAFAAICTFIDEAKRSGQIRRALDDAGFPHAEVAPSGRDAQRSA